MVDLGKQVRCEITGYTGTATGRAEYLDSPPQVQVTRADNYGKPESVWIVESRLVPAAEAAPGFGRGVAESRIIPNADAASGFGGGA